MNTFREGQFDDGGFAFEGSKLILFVDGFKFFGKTGFELFEHEGNELSVEFEHFKVVFLNRHFQVEADELAHVTMSERVFGSENGTDFEDTLEVRHDTHLLVELGRLGQACGLVEIFETENVRSSLRRSSQELRSVNFNKAVLEDELSENFADS